MNAIVEFFKELGLTVTADHKISATDLELFFEALADADETDLDAVLKKISQLTQQVKQINNMPSHGRGYDKQHLDKRQQKLAAIQSEIDALHEELKELRELPAKSA